VPEYGGVAFTGKLADALSHSLASAGAVRKLDAAVCSASAPGIQGSGSSTGARWAARPVLAASQTLGVPLVRAGWGDALYRQDAMDVQPELRSC